MAEERVVFAQSMEGLYRALDPLTPQERAAFLKIGVQRETKFNAAYPLTQYIDVMDACAASRFAGLPENERYKEVGRLFFGGFEKTLMGSALIALLKVIGPRRTLQRMTRSFRAANNFTEGTVEELAPNHHLVKVNFTLRPGFYTGLLEQGCLRAGAKDLSVKLLETRDLATTYELKWA
jgi:uncharacterized protein (TIGR02265 family)